MMIRLVKSTLLTALLAAALLLPWTSNARKPGPTGTFRNESGQLTLKYLGEGTVAVKLKTKYCELDVQDGATFAFPDGIHVMNKKHEPLLVLFYQARAVTVYGELPAFKQAYCKGGQDATGVFKRAGK